MNRSIRILNKTGRINWKKMSKLTNLKMKFLKDKIPKFNHTLIKQPGNPTTDQKMSCL